MVATGQWAPTSTRRSADLAAGTVLAFVGCLLVALAALTVLWAVPRWCSGNAVEATMVGIPNVVTGLGIGAVGLVALSCGLRLRLERPGVRPVAWILVAVAGLYLLGTVTRLAPAPRELWPDDLFLWVPLIVLAGAMPVACLLLAGLIAEREEGPRR